MLSFATVGATDTPTIWPTDPGHREAIDTLLDMAAAEHRWGDQSRAVDLLENVERIVGRLPQPYERIRRRCRESFRRP